MHPVVRPVRERAVSASPRLPHLRRRVSEAGAGDGRGSVYSTTTVRSRSGDYDVSIIELIEGPRLMSRVESVAPEDVRIGLAVVAGIAVEGETPVLVFRPESSTR